MGYDGGNDNKRGYVRGFSRVNSVDTLPTLRNVRKRIQGRLKIEKVLSMCVGASNVLELEITKHTKRVIGKHLGITNY